MPDRWTRFALGILFALAGCSYSTQARTARPGLETVAVPYFENRSEEPGIEVALTESILEALIRDRTLRVSDEDDADAIVFGVVRRYSYEESFYGSDRQAEEYKINVEVEVTFVDRNTQETLAGPERIRGTGKYFLSEGDEGLATARAEAAETIVENILKLVTEDW